MYNLDSIKHFLGSDYQIVGDEVMISFQNIKSIFDADANSLTWVSPTRKDAQELLNITQARLILCDITLQISDLQKHEKILIIVKQPKLVFLRILQAFTQKKQVWEIHPTAFIHPEAKIHPNTYIGAFTYIGICEIDEGTIIHGHCYLYDDVKIGKNVIIQAGSVIGGDGFGYERNEEGILEKFPHLGYVIIEDNVEIGANTCIDKGSLGNTLLKEGCKIDNLVHIAHNVIVGRNAVVIANAMIGGSVEIKDNAWIAPSVSIMQTLQIGNNTLVGLGSIVTKNIPDNETWAGTPAQRIDLLKEQLRKINKL